MRKLHRIAIITILCMRRQDETHGRQAHFHALSSVRA